MENIKINLKYSSDKSLPGHLRSLNMNHTLKQVSENSLFLTGIFSTTIVRNIYLKV